ncbi:MAG: DUF421 domain-containing protein [Armatimonadota bacterium]
MHISLPTAWGIIVRTSLVYIGLLTGVRISGKREIGQMTPFDLVVLLLISNSVQTAMVGADITLTGGLLSALTLLCINWTVSRFRMRSDNFRRWVEGVPVVLVTHGEPVHRNLMHEQITLDELAAALRQHEALSISDVELAMLEVDGSISVIRQDPDRPDAVIHKRIKGVHRKR